MASLKRNSDPFSLAAKTENCIEQLAKADPWYRSETMASLARDLLHEITLLMDEELVLLFDDGENAVLASSLPFTGTAAGTHDTLRTLNGEDDFLRVMREIVSCSARKVLARAESLGHHAALACRGVKFIANNLNAYISKAGRNDFLAHVVKQFAGAREYDKEEQTKDLPWRTAVGNHSEALAIDYFESAVPKLSSHNHVRRDPSRQNDTTHIMEFLFAAISGICGESREEGKRLPATSTLLVAVHRDVLTLSPASFMDAWSAGQTAQDWIDRRLKKPAMEHVRAARSEPPREALLADVVELVRGRYDEDLVPQLGPDALRHLIAEKVAVEHGTDHDENVYTLDAVYAVLTAPGVFPAVSNQQRLFNDIASILLQIAPPEAIEIASKRGGAERIAALYNPFGNEVNFHITDERRENRALADEEWIDSTWTILAAGVPSAGENFLPLQAGSR